MGVIRRRKGCICCKMPYDGRLPAMQYVSQFDFEAEVAMAAQDAAQMDAAMDMGLFELVHHLEYRAAQEAATAALVAPKRLDPHIAKQIGGFAKARAREARRCCQAAQRAFTQHALAASATAGHNKKKGITTAKGDTTQQPLFQKREEKQAQMGLFDIDELELGPLLGVGGFSKVYEIKAFHPKQQQRSSLGSKSRSIGSSTMRSNSSSKPENQDADENESFSTVSSGGGGSAGRTGCRVAPNTSSASPLASRKRRKSKRASGGAGDENGSGSRTSSKGRARRSGSKYTQQQEVARLFLTKHAQRLEETRHDDGEDAAGAISSLKQSIENEQDESLGDEEEIVFTREASLKSLLSPPPPPPPPPPAFDWEDEKHPCPPLPHPYCNEEKQEITTSSRSNPPSTTTITLPHDECNREEVEEKEAVQGSLTSVVFPPGSLLTVPTTAKTTKKAGYDKVQHQEEDQRAQELLRTSTATTFPEGGRDATRWSFDETQHDDDDGAVDENKDSADPDTATNASAAVEETTTPPPPTTTARYALKHLRQGLMDTPEKFAKAAMDLSCEGEMMMCLDHPHIVKLRGFGAGGPGAFKEGRHNDYFLIIDRLVDTLEDRVWIWRRAWKKQRRRRARNLFHWCKKRMGECVRAVSSGCCCCCVSGDGDSSYPDGTDKKVPHSRESPTKMINKTKKLPIDTLLMERLKVAYDLSSAMEYLHERHIIYRDLKPSNIGFDIRGDVKIFDFGLSRFLPTSTDDMEESFRMSNVGTRRYTAPEVEWKLPYNRQADVYSFGVVLWEILTMSSPRSLPRSRKHHDLPLFQACPCWPIELQRLLRSMLSVDPEQRPPISKVRLHLKQILMHMSDNDDNDEIELDDSFQRRRRSTFRVELLTSGLDELKRDFEHLFKEGTGDTDNKSHTSASTNYSAATVHLQEPKPNNNATPRTKARKASRRKDPASSLPPTTGAIDSTSHVNVPTAFGTTMGDSETSQ